MNPCDDVADCDGWILEDDVDSPDHYHCRQNGVSSFLCFGAFLVCLLHYCLPVELAKDAGVDSGCNEAELC